MAGEVFVDDDPKRFQLNVDIIYPIGSIYITTNYVSPEILFGGTWELIKDKFLLGAGDTYGAGSTGGEATHILTIDEMPSHQHDLIVHSGGTTAKPLAGVANTGNATDYAKISNGG